MMFVNARAIIERQTDEGIEVLLQIRDKPNEPQAWELPGGRIEEYESIVKALTREVYEETGLHVIAIKDDMSRHVLSTSYSSIEGLTPFFVYQTLEGPVDSIGFIFRCEVDTENPTQMADKQEAYGHQWFSKEDLAITLKEQKDSFDFLTPGLLTYYFKNTPS